MKRAPIIGAACVGVVAFFGVALSQDYRIDWYTIDGGGDMFCAGGDYELSGTIGQPDANAVVMTGGDFELTGGFWALGRPGLPDVSPDALDPDDEPGEPIEPEPPPSP